MFINVEDQEPHTVKQESKVTKVKKGSATRKVQMKTSAGPATQKQSFVWHAPSRDVDKVVDISFVQSELNDASDISVERERPPVSKRHERKDSNVSNLKSEGPQKSSNEKVKIRYNKMKL
jgi:ribosome-binding ATPase YchF (GTP1/OBG family)